MTRGTPNLEVNRIHQDDVVQIVVLAASANTQLRGSQLPVFPIQ